jgi:hypothetical protein
MAERDMHTKIKGLLDPVFSVWSVLRLYNEGQLQLESWIGYSTRFGGIYTLGNILYIVKDRPVVSSERAP